MSEINITAKEQFISIEAFAKKLLNAEEQKMLYEALTIECIDVVDKSLRFKCDKQKEPIVTIGSNFPSTGGERELTVNYYIIVMNKRQNLNEARYMAQVLSSKKGYRHNVKSGLN